MKTLFVVLSCFAACSSSAQMRTIDVQHYRFELTLSDTTDVIKGRAFITVKFLQPAADVHFDLQSIDAQGRGMLGHLVKEQGRALSSAQGNNRISFKLGSLPASKGDVRTFEILYEGVPKDGLIISKNKFGQRTFFGDNWPDRAKNWLPCVDDPADKASVEFLVTAPLQYQVVSNGVQVEETNLPNNNKLTHWKEEQPLATKIMVIGVAEFAVQYVGDTMNVPIYSWVYPRDRDKAFYDYAQAKEILPYFIKNIGPFPYRKLANVQSTTTYGGMENAGCIFYTETRVSGNRDMESLLTHEIAHQWFGDNVTETSFAHLWLSEGFATYFTDLYIGLRHGLDTMNMNLKAQRTKVLGFNRRGSRPVVDTITRDYKALLNANSYEKGAWALHMLRNDLGDTTFMKGVRAFYEMFAGGNANTDNFRGVMERVSGKNLELFFKQWLHTPGHPVIKVTKQPGTSNNSVIINIVQQQEQVFTFPLEVELKTSNGSVRKTLQVNKKEQSFTIDGVQATATLILDPGTKLLFEEAK
ncbi:MAG TPA: M1 family aminopeptidase [Chitinophagaceae bacterium]